jgi:hypothetical protein
VFAILVIESYANEYLILTLEYTLIHISYLKLSLQLVKFQTFLGNLQRLSTLFSSPRFLCRTTAFFRLAGTVGGQRALHTENSGFAHATLPWHISTFRGYRILFSIRSPYINRFTNHFSIHS